MTKPDTDTACFAAEDGGYRPLNLARSYWGRDALGGRAVVGLLGYEIERLHGADTLVPARLTVDMYRLAPFASLQIRSRVIRDGRRLRLVEADLIANGEAVARASCQFLAPTPPPAGRVWSPAPWNPSHPDTIKDEKREKRGAFEQRTVSGHLGATTEKGCWIRERFALVQGQPFTPFSRVAAAADFASPYSNMGDAGIRYMNTDVTIHLHRVPTAEWIGFEVTGHEASQGIAVGHCRLHDLDGPIGYVSCTAIANERRPSS
ncbi:thioesterase family protein [Sphingomonas immobilis]|uniref:Thioesterase family protein n=1 Tax=Sphingomonas immobilis TaxID=3063997 RepID=A0ABT8ZZ85_9SPHN|nr:acyl-CoA thioesterase domain-containing protein [Sphingomonas sp. CA1-15]MDO7841762.1 thioesterase family protein [Sphingomonas sp. CA1-15]